MTAYSYICYMDGTDFLYELAGNSDGNLIFPSVEALTEASGHDLTECGIAEIEVKFIRWVKEPVR